MNKDLKEFIKALIVVILFLSFFGWLYAALGGND